MTKPIIGGLLIDKPPGPTSHDIIDQARRALSLRRIGHTGTLDPFASGLLILLLGPATRLAEYLHDFPKTYHCTALLGSSSTTDDSTGQLTLINSKKPSRGDLDAALKHFQGVIEQTPPAYAARKINGQKLYTIARRQGSEAAQKLAAQASRPVTIHNLTLERYQYPEVDLTITVSTGTYIRSLIRDLGTLLTTGAYTQSLRRVQIGNWNLQKAIKLENLQNTPEFLKRYLISPTELVAHLTPISLDQDNVAKLQQGRKVPLSNKVDKLDTLPANTPLAIHNPDHYFVGIATFDSTTSLLSPHKILPSSPTA